MTETRFPVVAGTVLEVACNEGYTNQGDASVTCVEDDIYTFSVQPLCEIGKLQIKFRLIFPAINPNNKV